MRSARLTISQLKDGQKKEREKQGQGESLFTQKKEKEKGAGSKNVSLEISGRIKGWKKEGDQEEERILPPAPKKKEEAREEEKTAGPEEEGEEEGEAGADDERGQEIARQQAQAAQSQSLENDYRQKLQAKIKEAAKKKVKEKAAVAAKKAAARAVQYGLRQIAAGFAGLAGSVGWIGLLVLLAIIVIAALLAYVYSSCEQNALTQGICAMFGLTGSGEGNFGFREATPLGPAGANIEDLLASSVNARQAQDAHPQLLALISCVNNAYPAQVNGWWITSISDNTLTTGVSECQGANYSQPPCQHKKNSCHYGGTNCQNSVAFDVQPSGSGRDDPANPIYVNLIQTTLNCSPSRSFVNEIATGNHAHFSILNAECGCGDGN